jgi:hypothetical protein
MFSWEPYLTCLYTCSAAREAHAYGTAHAGLTSILRLQVRSRKSHATQGVVNCGVRYYLHGHPASESSDRTDLTGTMYRALNDVENIHVWPIYDIYPTYTTSRHLSIEILRSVFIYDARRIFPLSNYTTTVYYRPRNPEVKLKRSREVPPYGHIFNCRPMHDDEWKSFGLGLESRPVGL